MTTTTEIVHVPQEEIDALSAKWEAWKKHKPPGSVEVTPEQLEALAAYWVKVFAPRDRIELQPNGGVVMVRNTAQEMEYGEARRKVWNILQLRAAHIEVLENRPFEWVFGEAEKTHLQNLTRYFINDPACPYSLTKGLFLFGAPGTGKTEIMQAMERFARENKLTKAFHFCSLSEIHVRAKAEKDSDPVTPNVQYDRCFDEFGRYVGPITRFGDSLDINEAIIEQRYERSRRYGQITHFIANSTPNEMQEAFSPMVFDRLRSMCTSIHFEGESKR